MKLRTMIAVLIAVVSLASLASAQVVLWDQTEGYEGWSMGFFNVIAGGPPFGSTTYTVNDIVVPEGGWTLSTMRVYYDGFDPSWAGAVTEAVLYIEPKDGMLPMGDPGTGTTVTVVATTLPNGFLEVAGFGLDLALPEGEHWIGLTPVAPNANNIFVSVAAIGADSPSYDAFGFPMPMWMGWAPGLDGAILLEGEDSVASEASTLDHVKSLYR